MLMENFVEPARCIIIHTRDVEMANEPGAQIHFPKNARRRIRVPSSEALWLKWRLDKGSPGKKRYLHRIDRNKPTYH